MSKKLVFKINNEGSVTIDKVEGYGSGCIDATKKLEHALGKADEHSRRMTDEYNDDVEVDLDISEHIIH